MKSIACLLLLFLLGCRANDDKAIGPERSANAIIFDSSMYADGCELHLQLDSGATPDKETRYKFSPASLLLVRQVLAEVTLDPKQHVSLPVTVRYKETTQKYVLACGWYSPTVVEINILKIDRR